MGYEFDKFYGKIWKQGDSFIVTIPSNLIKYGGFKEGNKVEIMIKKKKEEEKFYDLE